MLHDVRITALIDADTPEEATKVAIDAIVRRKVEALDRILEADVHDIFVSGKSIYTGKSNRPDLEILKTLANKNQ